MLPDFLCIGAQKAGTSWLYHLLRDHPNVWLTPFKELHYFDMWQHHPSPLSFFYYDRIWCARFFSTIMSRLRGRGIQPLPWETRYLFGKRTMKWYLSLFTPRHNQKAGEMTPAYSILNKDEICTIYRWLPKLKLIFIMRDPIDRAWSAMRMAHNDKRLDIRDEKEVIEQLNGIDVRHRGNYTRTLDNWSSFYPKSQIFIGFLEEIQSGPDTFLRRLCRFLDIDVWVEWENSKLHQKIRSTQAYPMSPSIARLIANQHLPMLKELHRRYGSHTTRWLRHAKEILS